MFSMRGVLFVDGSKVADNPHISEYKSEINMNRELKFRAWDKFNGCFWYSDKYPNLAKFFYAMQLLIDGGNKLIFQQFTGIKDINGKEIYEGDKVDFTLTHDSYNKLYSSVVEWHNHAWRLNKIWLLSEISNIAVIGNIYEK